MLGTVCKAGDVMNLFTPGTPEWGVSEVAERMHVPKSSAHALLSTLVEIGLIRRTGSGRYRLGWRVFELHRTLVSTTDFLGPSRAVLAAFADAARVTVHVAAVRTRDVVYVDKITGAGAPTLSVSGVGLVVPAHSTAVGKVLLADRPAGYAGAVAEEHGLPRSTTHTTTSLAVLKDELAQVVQQGWAHDRGETVPGVCCVAVPIRDADGFVQAAVSATMPERQFQRLEQPIRRRLQRAATLVTRQACLTATAIDGSQNGAA
ncbi:IclR family transcriptional regulator [Amycolatopsis jejuensis]|uniref:IclR family transcriptional regulator n=1 Tax=Amycolatopsis jejuensis TaxID=330084 RepID=UPI0005275F67|nr:IclR family transcriptional regulator [Amycolatopsis jejuensis]